MSGANSRWCEESREGSDAYSARLSNELTPAADERLGRLRGRGQDLCFAREQHAVEAQRRDLIWLQRNLTDRPIPKDLVLRSLVPDAAMRRDC